jgi:hypothetical protein
MDRLFILIYAVSGFSVLTVETAWIRLLSLRLGGGVHAASLVFAAFFIFSALGNLLGAIAVGRTRFPATWYGAAELAFATAVAGLYAARDTA